MNMLDALKNTKQNPRLMSRPVSWIGLGAGITLQHGVWLIFSKDGSTISPIPGDEIWNEWENVQDTVVEAEIEKLVSQTP